MNNKVVMISDIKTKDNNIREFEKENLANKVKNLINDTSIVYDKIDKKIISKGNFNKSLLEKCLTASLFKDFEEVLEDNTDFIKRNTGNIFKSITAIKDSYGVEYYDTTNVLKITNQITLDFNENEFYKLVNSSEKEYNEMYDNAVAYCNIISSVNDTTQISKMSQTITSDINKRLEGYVNLHNELSKKIGYVVVSLLYYDIKSSPKLRDNMLSIPKEDAWWILYPSLTMGTWSKGDRYPKLYLSIEHSTVWKKDYRPPCKFYITLSVFYKVQKTLFSGYKVSRDGIEISHS